MNIRSKILCLSFCAVLSGCHKTAEELHIESGTIIKENAQLKNETVAQNKWLYSQMYKNYFWYKDLPDSATLIFNQPAQTFFDKLRSPKDRFSWIEPNLGYSGGASMFDHYGMEYREYQTSEGKTVNRVLLVLPNSPARKAGIERGDWFTTFQNLTGNMDLQLKLNKGEILDSKFYSKSIVNLYADLALAHNSSVSLDTIYNNGDHRIGYMVYNEFMDSEGNARNPYRIELRDIFSKLKQDKITDFVIDLRYNHGGYVSICQYLCGLILADEHLGKVSGYQRYNDKLTKIRYAETGNEEEILKFPNKASVGGNNLGISKIYAIVTGNTASASESLLNSLSPFITVVKIGTVSCGKGVGSFTIKDDNYKWQIQPITFRYFNALHVTVPDTGLIPDIVADETSLATYYELGDTKEYMLSIAINTITGNLDKSLRINNFAKLTIQPKALNFNHKRRIQGLIYQREKQEN